MSANLGELSVTLGAVFDAFERNVERAKGKLGSLAGEMRDMVDTAGKVAVASAAAGAAITAAFVKAGLDAVDSQAKLARAVNGTIDGLRALQETGHDAGVPINELNKATENLAVKLGEAQRSGSPVAKMLADLGLRAEDLANMDVDQRFAAIADRVRELGLSASQTADLARQLGIESAELVPVFMAGGDAIRAARDEIDEFGLSISEVDAAQVEAANDAMRRIFRTLANIRDQVAIALAPLIQEVAQRLNDWMREAGGFREAARSAAEVAITAFGKVADVIHGLRVVFKGVELVAVGFGAAVVSVLQAAAEAIASFIDGVYTGVNAAIGALNKLPKVEIATLDPFTESAFMEGLRGLADEARNRVGEVRGELHALAMQEMPGAKVEAFLQAIRDRAREAAKATVAAQRALGENAGGLEGFGVDTSAEDERAAKEAERRREQQQRQLDALREFLMDEAELERAHHEQRLATLDELREAELVGTEEYHALREELEEEHTERLEAIRRKGLDDIEKLELLSQRKRLAYGANFLAEMTAGVSTHSKKMFELNKLAAIAQTALDSKEAIVGAYKVGAKIGGPALGAAFAAAAGAATAAQIQAIRSQEFGQTGGTAPGLAGSTPAPAVSPVSTTSSIFIEGLTEDQLFSGKAVRRLMQQISEAAADGTRIVVA